MSEGSGIPGFLADVVTEFVKRPRASAVQTGLFPGAQPPIVTVDQDSVTIRNILGQNEKVPMWVFASSQWDPRNPGNASVSEANEIYRDARLQILKQAGRRPAATFDGCTDEQARVLNNSLTLAAGSVETAIARLDAAERGIASALDEVALHFKTRDVNDIGVIRDNYKRAKLFLDNVIGFTCGGIGCTVMGQPVAGANKYGTFGGATMSVCAPFWSQPNEMERTLSIVHESCHLGFGGTIGLRGEAYYGESFRLGRKEAMANAENYGNFAVRKNPPTPGTP